MAGVLLLGAAVWVALYNPLLLILSVVCVNTDTDSLSLSLSLSLSHGWGDKQGHHIW